MGLKIDRKKDTRVVRAFAHKIADIPDGATVSSADLTQATLREGAPIGVGADGIYHVVKMAKVITAASNTEATLEVAKGHDFKVGDVVMAAEKSKAYAIKTIETSDPTKDTVTIDTTLGVAIPEGGFIYQAAAVSAGTSSAFKYKAKALVGESYDVAKGDNLIVNAWVIGVVHESNINPIGDAVKALLPGVVFI